MAPNEELPTWKKLIRSKGYHEQINSWPDDDPRLLAVYYIAEQNYCEWKATYEKEEGRIPDSELDQRSRKEGREGHQAIIQAKSADEESVHEGSSGPGPTPLGESIDAGDEIITDSQTLIAPLDGFEGPSGAEGDPFYLIGEADNIVFKEGVPKAVVERKFVRDRREDYNSNLEITYTNERIQGWLYGRLLDNLGFNTSELQIILLKHHKSLRNDSDHQIEALDRSIDGLEGETVSTKYGPDGNAVMGSNTDTVTFVEPYG
jgi:hypothetical protein